MKERLITAICLLAVVLPVIYFGGQVFNVLLGITAIIAVWELIKMREAKEKAPLLIKLITFAGVAIAILINPLARALYWNNFIIAGLLIINFFNHRRGKADTSFYILVICYIGMAFRALLQIRTHSLMLFIFLIATVILTDTAAYFVGRLLGKKKLAPVISPNKTIAGAVGGWLVGAGFAITFGLIAGLFNESWVLIALAVGLPPLSQAGDLIASALKRQHGIKDYGKIFPGHGGVMDRVDSQLLAAMLIYAMMLIGGVV